MNAGREVSVRWDAGEWSHSGSFPLKWLRGIDTVDMKKKPQCLVAVRKPRSRQVVEFTLPVFVISGKNNNYFHN